MLNSPELSKICVALLTQITPLLITYNPLAKTYVDRAERGLHVSQSDVRFTACGLRREKSGLCGLTNLFNDWQTIEKFRNKPVYADPIDHFRIYILNYIFGVHDNAAAIKDVFNLEEIPEFYFDARNGTFGSILLKPDSNLMRYLAIRSKPFLLTDYESQIETELLENKLVTASVYVTQSIFTHEQRSSHSITILGINKDRNWISYSDPLMPNTIVVTKYRPVTLAGVHTIEFEMENWISKAAIKLTHAHSITAKVD